MNSITVNSLWIRRMALLWVILSLVTVLALETFAPKLVHGEAVLRLWHVPLLWGGVAILVLAARRELLQRYVVIRYVKSGVEMTTLYYWYGFYQYVNDGERLRVNWLLQTWKYGHTLSSVLGTGSIPQGGWEYHPRMLGVFSSRRHMTRITEVCNIAHSNMPRPGLHVVAS